MKPPQERRDIVVPGPLRRRHARENIAAALCAFILAIVLMFSGALAPFDHHLGEGRAKWMDRAPTGQLAIVEIDAKSLAAINTWPWSRSYHAKLLDRLAADGVEMVAFDVDFSARSDSAGDKAFADALHRIEPVILPIFQQKASDLPGERELVRNRPANAFGGAWVGGVNILPGRDGVVRDFPAATMIDGRIQPAMPVLLADNDGWGDRTFVPDWSIDEQRIPRFSFVDVINGRVARGSLAGKRVIVGATAIELGDRYTIPRFGTVPGVVVQALAAESLLQHRARSRLGRIPLLIATALIAGLFAMPFRRFRTFFPLLSAVSLAALFFAPFAIENCWPVSLDSGVLLSAALFGASFRAVAQLRHRLRCKALSDVQTGLANRRALEEALNDRSGEEVILYAASIDRYDHMCSVIGSAGCAELLREASARIHDMTGQPVHRVADDTLAWAMPRAGDDIDQMYGLVTAQFRNPVHTAAGDVDVELTVGIHLSSGLSASAEVERVLSAVIAARATGRRRQRFEQPAPAARRDLSLMGELRRAMEEGEVFVAYQPKLNIRSGEIDHAEALVRWKHPVEGFIPPSRFLPLAESTGVVRDLTRFVLRRVIHDLRSNEAVRASVNVSAADISEAGFADEVEDLLRGPPFDASRLTIEITESAIIASPATAVRVLETLRGLGIRLSVDDYGTGQSTLSYLKNLPLDELKIDKSFVASMCTSESDRIMVRSTVELAHLLGLSVVAEGIEDSDTLSLLKSYGCDYGQGYLFGKAASFQELAARVRNNHGMRRVA